MVCRTSREAPNAKSVSAAKDENEDIFLPVRSPEGKVRDEEVRKGCREDKSSPSDSYIYVSLPQGRKERACTVGLLTHNQVHPAAAWVYIAQALLGSEPA
jgi:hypothetical protein